MIYDYHVTWRDKNGIKWGHSFGDFAEALDYYRGARSFDGRFGVQLDSDLGLTDEQEAQL